MGLKPTRPPRGLDPAGTTLWRSLAAQVAADGLELDARESVLLAEACREADMLERIQTALVDAPMMMKGAQGQQVANPLIGEARRSRTTIASLLKQLGLQDPLVAAKTGSGSRTTPWQAREAANARQRRV